MEQKVLRTGTLVIACAVILRLFSSLLPILPSQAVSVMLFLQTGRLVKPGNISFTPDATQQTDPISPDTSQPEQEQPALPVFSADDAAGLFINSSFRYDADLSALLTQPLSWNLTGDRPTVLIVHSHGSESYAPTGEYAENSPYHTLESDYNMLCIGRYVTQLLTAEGISVLHDTTLHDQPSYNASYQNSRTSIQNYLEEYPSIRLVLDLHRDSIEDANGNQVVQTVFAGNETLAPLMLVVGTDYGGLNHPQWRENLALALKLQTQLESLCPGICRDINLRTERFNQDLSPGTLLIEVGTSGNTRQEALRSARVLADAIISLAYGSA